MGTPCWRVFCIGLCVVAFCHSALPAETDEINKPTPAQLAPAQKTTADGPSRGHKNDAGPTLPNPVEPKSSKKKMDSDAKAATDNVTESPSDQTDSPPSDQPIIDDETPQFIDDVPLVTENILLAPEPYEPTCKSRGRCTKQCRQCCQCDCSRCGCDYDTYLLVDFLFFKRNNATSGAVVAETTSGVPELTTRSTNPGTAPGIRLFGGRLRKNGIGWEFGYTGVFGMFGERTARSSNNLQVPPPLGSLVNGWTNLDAVRSTYTSSLNMCEVNIFTSETTVKGGPRSPFPWHRV
ncbi:MAG: hypothetical protein ACR2NI_04395, partial [Pirellulales bacterium]